MKKMWASILSVALLFVAVPVATGHLGGGFYFTSGLIGVPKTDLLGPGGWKVGVAGFYDRWGESPDIGFPGGNINKDVFLSLGLTSWLQVGVIVMETPDIYAGQLQLRLLEETRSRPALCLGVLARLDKVDSIAYLVVGKHNFSLPLLGETNLYGGVGFLLDSEVPPGLGGEVQVRDKLQGIFLGIEKIHTPEGWERPLTFMAEYDAKNINFGLSYEIFRGVRLNAAVVKVEKFFGEGNAGVVLAVELFRILS